MVETGDEQGQEAGTTTEASGGTMSRQKASSVEDSSIHEIPLPPLTGMLRPLVDFVAGINVSVHTKLLAGFLALALLLLGMGILNSFVIERMSQRVQRIEELQDLVDLSHRMEYLITAQSHYRAMALLTRNDRYNNDIRKAKQDFLSSLDKAEKRSGRERGEFFAQVRQINDRFTTSSSKVLDRYQRGDMDGATRLHLDEEHRVSHLLETAMQELQADAAKEMKEARDAFNSARQLLRRIVILFSVTSIAAAFLLGFVLTWSLIRPVRKIDDMLAAIASGDFTRRIEVPNRDEFGALSTHLNAMSAQLATLYSDLRSVSEHLQAVVDNAMDAIITIDERGIIKSFNPAAEAMFGYAAAEVIGQHMRMLMPEPNPRNGTTLPSNPLVESLSEITGSPREVVGRHKDGKIFPMDLSIGEMCLGEERVFIGIARDITERKRTQEELALARDQALEANRAKSAFLAKMSHELRTPLNAIIGYSEMLQEEAEELGQSDFVPDLKKIEDAGKHLLMLINDILDLSKVEAGKMGLYLESFDIAQLIQDVVNTIQPLVKQKANSLVVRCADDLGTMHADATKVRQILFNLLSNAAKFTEQGFITMEATRERDGADWIIFRVSDTGIGMPRDQLGRLFQAFTQADNVTNRNYGGTGLGLAITKHFCEMMGGEITVTSEMGRGSTFTIRLPAVISDPKVQGVPRTEQAALPDEACTVLIIDDDPATCDLLQRFLRAEGFRAATAMDGQEGLRLARELRPIAITLDVMMPNMDGWAVLSALKADPELAPIPVIMLTIVDDKNMGFALGAADYLTKPIDRNRLAALLEKYRRERYPGPVLVVEDDAATREMLRRTLEKEGWRVTEAEHGRAALEHIMEDRPALILLDLIMPEMDGFGLIAELQQQSAWRSIPIVVISAKELTVEDRRRLDGSVTKILEKGAYSREELLAEVRHLVMDCVSRSNTVKHESSALNRNIAQEG